MSTQRIADNEPATLKRLGEGTKEMGEGMSTAGGDLLKNSRE